MLPITGRVRQGTLSIPTLDGGVNWRDFGETVNDNQLTDAVNVREKGGLVQTRPRVKTSENTITDETFMSVAANGVIRTKIFDDIVVSFNKKNFVFCITSIYNSEYEAEANPISSRVNFYFLAADGTKKNISTYYFGSAVLPDSCYEIIAKAAMKNQYIYSYVYFRTKDPVVPEEGYVFTINTLADPISITKEDNFYIPTVFTNGLPSPTEKYSILTGDYLEGYNRINPMAKAVYSTYDYKSAPLSSKAIFAIPIDLKSFDSAGTDVVAKHTYFSNGTATVETHTVTLTANGYGAESGAYADGWQMFVDGQIVYFNNVAVTPNVYAETDASNFIHNNLEITFPLADKSYPYKKAMDVFKMTNSVWFGGAANGISDGTRLFMAGSIDEEQKSLILWSDLNDPLYFPENNYAYVGDRGQRINALARQGEALVILKDRETYMSVYRQSTAPTAENVINQDFVDLTTANAYFPMISVNSKIGCDAPDTVQLCNNRLVWASSSDRKVYTLVTNDQFSENTILDVSGMIDKRLPGNGVIKTAQSADFDGMYLLFCGSEVFCLDYQSYGFANASYYQRSDAEKRIPWWYWRFPNPISYASVIGEDFLGIFERQLTNEDGDSRLINIPLTLTENDMHDTAAVIPSSLDGDITTEAVPVENMIASKKYSFGAQTVYKSIPCVRAEFSSGSDVDESSALIITFTADGKYHDEYQTHFIEGVDEFVNRTIRPRIRAARRFDFVLTYYGVLRVGNIEITYQVCGGAK